MEEKNKVKYEQLKAEDIHYYKELTKEELKRLFIELFIYGETSYTFKNKKDEKRTQENTEND